MNDINWIELILLMLKIYMSNFTNMSNAPTVQHDVDIYFASLVLCTFYTNGNTCVVYCSVH